MKRLIRWVLLCLLAVNAHAVQAQTSSLTEGELQKKLGETWAEVKRLQTLSPEAARPELDKLAAEWSTITTVEVNGQRLPLNTEWLVSQLHAERPDLEQLDRQLTSLYYAKDEWPEPRHTTQDVAVLQPILARPEFQWDMPSNPFQEWWQNILQQFQNWLNSLLPAEAAGVEFFSWAVPILAAVVLALILFYILRGLSGGFSTDARLPEQHAEEPLTSEAALSRAQNFSAAGDYRTAARFIYLATLLKLDERGLLRYDRSLTNREYVRRVSHKPQLAENLREVVEVFDRVWYGFQPLDATSYAAYARRVDELERLT